MFGVFINFPIRALTTKIKSVRKTRVGAACIPASSTHFHVLKGTEPITQSPERGHQDITAIRGEPSRIQDLVDNWAPRVACFEPKALHEKDERFMFKVFREHVWGVLLSVDLDHDESLLCSCNWQPQTNLQVPRLTESLTRVQSCILHESKIITKSFVRLRVPIVFELVLVETRASSTSSETPNMGVWNVRLYGGLHELHCHTHRFENALGLEVDEDIDTYKFFC